MHDRRFADAIDELHPHALSGMQHECRIDVLAPAIACEISLRKPRWSIVGGFERRSAQRQRLVVEDKAPQETALAGNEQRQALLAAAAPVAPH